MNHACIMKSSRNKRPHLRQKPWKIGLSHYGSALGLLPKVLFGSAVESWDLNLLSYTSLRCLLVSII